MDLTFDEETGKIIIGSNFEGHLGKQVLSSLKFNGNKIHQVQITTDEKETNLSVLSRTIRVAKALQLKNVEIGDVVMICAVNHNDASIPMLSSFCIGAIPINLVVGMTNVEIRHFFQLTKPKIIFIDAVMKEVFLEVMRELKYVCEIVIFGDSIEDNLLSFARFSELADGNHNFKCVEFDPESTIALAICSSGTTGLPKVVTISHKSAVISIKLFDLLKNNGEKKSYYSTYLNFSPTYWITGTVSVLFSCLLGCTRIQSVESFSIGLFKLAAEKYKPESCFLSPMAINELCNYPDLKKIDLTCIKIMYTGGSFVSVEVTKKLNEYLPNGVISQSYACTETGVISSNGHSGDYYLGKICPWCDWKIVDPDTEERLGNNQPGELRVKSITNFQGYYNDPVSTAAAFDSEMYYKTGDLIYIDDEQTLHFVDRIKEVIKYRNYQIAPAELEAVICSIPEIQYAAVVGVPDLEDGEHPMAFVQLSYGAKVSAQKIKDVIKDKLSDQKQLRGGVVFIDVPFTYTGKLDRKTLRIMKTKFKGE